MAEHEMTYAEYASLRRGERAWFLKRLDEAARLIMARNVAIEVCDRYRRALSMRLMSDGEFMARAIARAVFSVETFFLLLGSCVLLPSIVVTLSDVPAEGVVAAWLLLILALRILARAAGVYSRRELANYGEFRSYMQHNRHEVAANLERKQSAVSELDARIRDQEQCIIPPAYQGAAGELLYIAKTCVTSDMESTIREYNHQRALGELRELLGAIERQNGELMDELWEIERRQDVLEGLLALHMFRGG